MDMEETTKLVGHIKISNKVEEKILIDPGDLKEGEAQLNHCLVAKVFSAKFINRDTFRTHLPRIMQLHRKVIMELVGPNTFILNLLSEMDRNRELNDGPWNFFQDFIVIKEPQGLDDPNSMQFDSTSMWVQLHNVPIAFLNRKILLKLGSRLGEIEEIDEGSSGSFLDKFRVKIDISKPLKYYLRAGICDKEDIIILLTYERLPDFCYRCGIIGHHFRNCTLVVEDKSTLEYVSWLRAQIGGMKGKVKQSSPKKVIQAMYSQVDEPEKMPISDSFKSGEELVLSRVPRAHKEIKRKSCIVVKACSPPDYMHSEISESSLGNYFMKNPLKWKRMDRDQKAKKVVTPPNSDLKLGQKREAPLSPNSMGDVVKRIQVVEDFINPFELSPASNPASPNELHNLERPGAWKPTGIPGIKEDNCR
ncbi:uncharacterized protein [Henckelia pumila]|uniref:uncharacterized protein n=1 Tax=Henckelia pumila TaxID=405737 RepID=UPI003C6E5C2C